MTYNLGKMTPEKLATILEVMDRVQPDVAGFQELYDAELEIPGYSWASSPMGLHGGCRLYIKDGIPYEILYTSTTPEGNSVVAGRVDRRFVAVIYRLPDDQPGSQQR